MFDYKNKTATFASLYQLSPDGGTGRHAGLKILFPLRKCGFDSRSGYNRKPVSH